jgi:hypothetical protein
VAGEVVTVLVIKNAGIVRRVGPIRAARRFHQRSILKQISTWAKMDLPVGRNWFVLVQIVMLRGQPIVTALKGQPTIAALEAVPSACSFRDRMMSIHNGRDAWQRRRTQLTKQALDIRRNEVEMKVRIHLAEVRCLDVSPPKLRFRERNATFEELCWEAGGSIPVDLIHPSASPSGLEYEITVRIRERIANRYNAISSLQRERRIHFSSISHAHVLSPKPTAAFDP